MKHVLVAGGAGFVGSHLCESFLKQGYKVTCIDNLLTGRETNIRHLLPESGFTFRHEDVAKPLNFPEQIDYICNLASPASPVDYRKYPIETLRVGAEGTWQLLELAKAKGAVFLLASTSEVYGDPKIHPQKEEYWGNVNPVGPRSCYDEAKRYAESLTATYRQQCGVETRIARIFNTYGPRMQLSDGRALPNFLTQALQEKEVTVYGDGSQTRSFCYVADMIDGLQKLLLSQVATPVNIGNPQETTLLEFATTIIEMTNSKSRIVFHPLPQDDPKVRRPDITKAKELLGWQPTLSLKQGLEKTIPYFAENLKSA